MVAVRVAARTEAERRPQARSAPEGAVAERTVLEGPKTAAAESGARAEAAVAATAAATAVAERETLVLAL